MDMIFETVARAVSNVKGHRISRAASAVGQKAALMLGRGVVRFAGVLKMYWHGYPAAATRFATATPPYGHSKRRGTCVLTACRKTDTRRDGMVGQTLVN